MIELPHTTFHLSTQNYTVLWSQDSVYLFLCLHHWYNYISSIVSCIISPLFCKLVNTEGINQLKRNSVTEITELHLYDPCTEVDPSQNTTLCKYISLLSILVPTNNIKTHPDYSNIRFRNNTKRNKRPRERPEHMNKRQSGQFLVARGTNYIWEDNRWVSICAKGSSTRRRDRRWIWDCNCVSSWGSGRVHQWRPVQFSGENEPTPPFTGVAKHRFLSDAADVGVN